MERIRREGNEAVQREAAGDVFDVRIQTAVFMHHQHHRQLALGVLGRGQIAAHGAVAFRRRDLHEAGIQAFVVRRDQRRRKARAQRTEQTRRCNATDCITRGRRQEIAPTDAAVHVLVEQFENFRIKIGSGLAAHVVAPWTGMKRPV